MGASGGGHCSVGLQGVLARYSSKGLGDLVSLEGSTTVQYNLLCYSCVLSTRFALWAVHFALLQSCSACMPTLSIRSSAHSDHAAAQSCPANNEGVSRVSRAGLC